MRVLLFLVFPIVSVLFFKSISSRLRFNNAPRRNPVYIANETKANKCLFWDFRHSVRSLERSPSDKNLTLFGGKVGRETVEATFLSNQPYSFTAILRLWVINTRYFTTVAGFRVLLSSFRPWMISSLVMSDRNLYPSLSLQNAITD